VNAVVLTAPEAVAVIATNGGRVLSLFDSRNQREMLARFPGAECQAGAGSYKAAFTGGWDVLFPNDSPTDGFPDHGRAWSAPFEVVLDTGRSAVLHARLDRPDAELERHYSLLEPPRCGLTVASKLVANTKVTAALFASHIAVATDCGGKVHWNGDMPAIADRLLPGRFSSDDRLAGSVTLPPADAGLAEVLYLDGASEVKVTSGGSMTTRIAWDASSMPHAWIVSLSGEWDLPFCLVVEPATSRPFDLDAAAAAGRALTFAPGEVRRFTVTVEAVEAGATGA
jgi:hypothetical protein